MLPRNSSTAAYCSSSGNRVSSGRWGDDASARTAEGRPPAAPSARTRGRRRRGSRAVAALSRRGPAGAAARRPGRLRRGSRVRCAAAAAVDGLAAAHAGWPRVRDLRRRCADAEPAAVVLQQVHPGAAVGRVDHQVHGTVGRQHLVQRPQALVGVGQVMQDPGADDVLEAAPQFGRSLERQLPKLEVLDAVLALKLHRLLDAGGADIDADHLRPWPAQRDLGGLRGAATGHQDAAVVPIRRGWPEQAGYRRAGDRRSTIGDSGPDRRPGAGRGGARKRRSPPESPRRRPMRVQRAPTWIPRGSRWAQARLHSLPGSLNRAPDLQAGRRPIGSADGPRQVNGCRRRRLLPGRASRRPG